MYDSEPEGERGRDAVVRQLAVAVPHIVGDRGGILVKGQVGGSLTNTRAACPRVHLCPAASASARLLPGYQIIRIAGTCSARPPITILPAPRPTMTRLLARHGGDQSRPPDAASPPRSPGRQHRLAAGRQRGRGGASARAMAFPAPRFRQQLRVAGHRAGMYSPSSSYVYPTTTRATSAPAAAPPRAPGRSVVVSHAIGSQRLARPAAG